MTKISKTLAELQEFDKQAFIYLTRNGFLENGKVTNKVGKLASSITNVLNQYSKHAEVINGEMKEEVELLRINNCLEDEKTKEVLTDDKGNYKFSKQGLIKLNNEIKVVRDRVKETKVEIHQRIIETSEELTDTEREIFKDLVI